MLLLLGVILVVRPSGTAAAAAGIVGPRTRVRVARSRRPRPLRAAVPSSRPAVLLLVLLLLRVVLLLVRAPPVGVLLLVVLAALAALFDIHHGGRGRRCGRRVGSAAGWPPRGGGHLEGPRRTPRGRCCRRCRVLLLLLLGVPRSAGRPSSASLVRAAATIAAAAAAAAVAGWMRLVWSAPLMLLLRRVRPGLTMTCVPPTATE